MAKYIAPEMSPSEAFESPINQTGGARRPSCMRALKVLRYYCVCLQVDRTSFSPSAGDDGNVDFRVTMRETDAVGGVNGCRFKGFFALPGWSEPDIPGQAATRRLPLAPVSLYTG